MKKEWLSVAKDSPVEMRRKELPRGDGQWAGFDHVYSLISSACEKMAIGNHTWLSELHIDCMAILGSGHEETMKYHVQWLRMYGWIK